MKNILLYGHEAALVINGTYHWEFPDDTNMADMTDEAEAVFCKIPKPHGRLVDMSNQVKQNLSFPDNPSVKTYDDYR